jgi:hypothetical protein
MKILFICGSAEPGKDGVGDYTRRLCGEIIRLNHDVQILSLCDNQVTSFKSENQLIEEFKILVHRIPAGFNNSRFAMSQEIINKFKPDWISLQYVPYSFNPKGLPLWLPSFLNAFTGKHQLHIMFHELWIGMDSRSSLKSKIIGFLLKQDCINLKSLLSDITSSFCPCLVIF